MIISFSFPEVSVFVPTAHPFTLFSFTVFIVPHCFLVLFHLFSELYRYSNRYFYTLPFTISCKPRPFSQFSEAGSLTVRLFLAVAGSAE